MSTVPQHALSTCPKTINQTSINMRTADRKMLAVKGWVGKGSISRALFDSIRNDLRTRGKMGEWGGEGGDHNEMIVQCKEGFS